MIVNYTQEGWQVITQRAHGVLAAQLAANWTAKDRPARWIETLLAIAEHDDAENELDGEELLTITGGPLNYAMKKFDLAHCQKLASLTLTKSRYIALLTSMHMVFLYATFADEDKSAKVFLEEQKQQQATWRKELNLNEEESLRMYALLEWCDAFSLLVCKGEMQPEERRQEISSGPDKKMYSLIQLTENTLTVEPWPFELPAFNVSYESRIIPDLQFTSSQHFREAFLAADVSETVWILEKRTTKKANKKNKVAIT